MIRLAIGDIRTDGGTQPRAAINPQTVTDYMNDMAAGAEFPPVDVFYDGSSYWLADGFHRIRAAEKAGRTEIVCEVHQGTCQDAQWFSFGVNKGNGLRRTNGDKQRAVKSALQHSSATGLSDGQIAEHVGVSDQMVRVHRRRLEATPNGLESSRRTGRDGRTIETANIGKPPAEPPRLLRSANVDRLAHSILAFVEATKHFAQLVRWLGETAGDFGAAEHALSHTSHTIRAASAEIERTAVAADPLNASRLGIQENTSCH